jgi:hypothetical protein
MKLADRIRHVELSPTFKINAMARRMKERGIDVLDFPSASPTLRPRKRRRKPASPRSTATSRATRRTKARSTCGRRSPTSCEPTTA